MQTLETVKVRGQASLANLVEKAKEQPDDVKTWGVTAGGAIVGAVALTAVASGVLAVLATLAAPPVALTVGAIGGGVLGWNYMRNRQTTPPPFTPPAETSVPMDQPSVVAAPFVESAVLTEIPPAEQERTPMSAGLAADDGNAAV